MLQKQIEYRPIQVKSLKEDKQIFKQSGEMILLTLSNDYIKDIKDIYILKQYMKCGPYLPQNEDFGNETEYILNKKFNQVIFKMDTDFIKK